MKGFIHSRIYIFFFFWNCKNSKRETYTQKKKTCSLFLSFFPSFSFPLSLFLFAYLLGPTPHSLFFFILFLTLIMWLLYLYITCRQTRKIINKKLKPKRIRIKKGMDWGVCVSLTIFIYLYIYFQNAEKKRKRKKKTEISKRCSTYIRTDKLIFFSFFFSF